MANQTIYTVGGTIQAGGGIYISRKADDELLGYCRASEFAFILSSRQVGKSSLMVRTACQLESENIRSVIIDLSGIGVKVSADQWYLGILNVIAKTLKLKTDIFTWWSEGAGLGPAQQMTNFFSDVLLKEVNQPVVLFFDEIDSTLSIPFADDFFAALRAIYNARSTVSDFKRLSFVMIGVATPSDLISDSARTPFNIGRRVELTDFTLQELHPLAEGLGENAEEVLDWVFNWTNGQPYLTQRLCQFLTKSKDGITQGIVESAVKDLFLGEKGMEDNNLQFVRDMLLERATDKTGVLKIYQRVIKDKKPVEDDEQSINKSHLKLSGVVRRRQTNLRVSNLIYQNAFGLNWVREHLPRIERRSLVIALGTISVLAFLLAVLGVTGKLNKFIYRPLETKSDWVDIPAGEFLMGDESGAYDERPVHKVYLDGYQINAYEVANKYYVQCVHAGGCAGGGYEYQDATGKILNRMNDKVYADHPVVSITWFQAQIYCEWIGARLPTETEWEKAARGTDGKTYPWGENIDCTHANYGGAVGGACVDNTTPIGNYAIGQSPYGVYDLVGNVWEWTADWYDVYSGGDPSVTPDFGQTFRALRGGSWLYNHKIIRSSNRYRLPPDLGFSDVGFRCARSLP